MTHAKHPAGPWLSLRKRGKYPPRSNSMPSPRGDMSLNDSPSTDFPFLSDSHQAPVEYPALLQHIALYLVGLLFCHCAWSLSVDLTLPQLNHKAWTVAEGAPREVSALAQTRDGTLWVGGTTGLSRFDGIRFIHYPEASDEPLQSMDISALTASPDGGLWIGFRFGGVSFLRNGHVTRYDEPEGLPSGSVVGFAWDHDGTLWAAAGGGLARFHGTRWQRIASESIPIAFGVLVDPAGTLWVATAGRVLARAAHEDQFREMAQWSEHDNEYMDYIPFAVAPDGRVWTWTRDGLTRMASPTALQPTAPQLTGPQPTASQPTGPRPTDPKLTRPQPNGNHTVAWAGHSPAPLLFDRQGNLWLGGGTVRRVPPSELLSDPAPPHLENFTDGSNGGGIALLEDHEGNIWVGTENGLGRLSHSNIIRAPLPPCSWDYVFAAGDAGTLWAACSPDFPST